MDKGKQKAVLHQLGLNEQMINNVLADVVHLKGDCTVQNYLVDNGDVFQLRLDFKSYEAYQYNLRIKSRLQIPDIVLSGIDVKQLDARMQQIDWGTRKASIALDHYFLGAIPELGHEEIRSVINNVFSLTEKDTVSQKMAERLMAKHWLESTFRSNFPNYLDHLRDKIEKSCTVPIHYGVTINEAKDVLMGVKTSKPMNINGKLLNCELAIESNGSMLIKSYVSKTRSAGQDLAI